MSAGIDVRTSADLARVDGEEAILHGRYEAVPQPVRGTTAPARPRDRAVVVLSDGVSVYLEPLDAVDSVRASTEIERLDGRSVRACGRVHVVMPSAGAGLVAPCLSGVRGLEEER